MSTWAWIAVVSLEGAAIVALGTTWLVQRRRVSHLRSRVRALEAARSDTAVRRPRRLVPRPEDAVKAVWETATLVRDKGVGTALRTSIGDLAGWAQVERPDLVELAGADGTVAVLFSDIEGSTSLNDRLGDRAWVRLLGIHDRVVRRQVDRHAGHVVKTQGDGFMVAFADAEAAVRCAIGVQRALEKGRRLGKEPIAVRVGVHQGSVVHRDNDIFGRNVALAARVAGLAEGGEVLLSEPVARAVADVEEVLLGEQRSVTLKGLPGEHVVTAVDWRG